MSDELPNKTTTNAYYTPDEVYQKGLQELQVILTTFWDNKSLEGCFGESTFYKAWAQGIIHRLPRLVLPQEVSLFLSHHGHCIYVSLTKVDKYYVVRVDNRWINTAPNNSHPITQQTLHQKEMKCLQPCLVSYFPVQTWGKHQAWLLNYIMGAGQVNGQQANQVIPHLYQTNQKPPKEGKLAWAKQWPWRPLQTKADNCFMRSHNVGYRIRLGNDLYEWFRQKALGSYLLQQKFVKNQLRSSSDNSPKQKGGPTTSHNKLKGNGNRTGHNKKNPNPSPSPDEEETKEDSPQPPKQIKHTSPSKRPQPKQTTSSKLPTHQKVMQRFSQQLNVNYNAIYSGIAAEQSLVRYAGLTRSQKGATFGRDTNTGHTWFRLRLDPDEAERFIEHYLIHHAGWIQDMRLLPDDGLLYLVVDTTKLYHEVIPKLKGNPSKLVNKQQGGPNSVVNKENTKYTPPKKSQRKSTTYVPPKKSQYKQTTPSKKPPTHQEVMQRFAKQLKVNYNAIYGGIAAEQALVRYAGLTRVQTGAMFRSDNRGRTWFKLRLTSDEAELFLNHYQTLHADAIKKRETLGNGWVRITFDTDRLYGEIIPRLA